MKVCAPRRPGTPARRRTAFSLIEVLTVMAALSLVLGVLAVALAGALRLEKASAAALDGMGARRDLADQFRADVAQATDAPGRWQQELAGPACLILVLGSEGQVVYRWEGEHLFRTETAAGTTHRREVAVGRATDVEFARSDAGGPLLTLRLFRAGKDGARRPSAEFKAALGGDLR